MMDIKEDKLLWFINFLIKKSASLADKSTKGSGLSHTIKSTPQSKQLAKELHKPIIRKFKLENLMKRLRTMFGVLI